MNIAHLVELQGIETRGMYQLNFAHWAKDNVCPFEGKGHNLGRYIDKFECVSTVAKASDMMRLETLPFLMGKRAK